MQILAVQNFAYGITAVFGRQILFMWAEHFMAPQLFFFAGWQCGGCPVVSGLQKLLTASAIQEEKCMSTAEAAGRNLAGKWLSKMRAFSVLWSLQLCKLPFWFTRSALACNSQEAYCYHVSQSVTDIAAKCWRSWSSQCPPWPQVSALRTTVQAQICWVLRSYWYKDCLKVH